MPRHNRRADPPAPIDEARARQGAGRLERRPDGDWQVRTVPGSASDKTYRCPGCDHEIVPGVPHVVVWPADERGGVADRRHWHNGCWRSAPRR